MITRRDFTIGAGALAGTLLSTSGPSRAAGFPASLPEDIARIERESGGRLGVVVRDTLSNATISHHGEDLFPMCSTFKLLACAAVLKRVDDGKETLDRQIKIEASDIVPNSTFIKAPVGMSLAALCEAAMTYSDNTAGNVILASFGGPLALTAYARSIGDNITRLDRIEPDLNEAIPGDVRDTTTPAAMLKNVQTLVLGNALSAASKGVLTQWLIGNKTGDTRLRAGVPAGWRVGDKTGSGERGSTNDLGLVWPPQRAPILVSIYLTQTEAAADKRNATLAAVGRAIAAAS